MREYRQCICLIMLLLITVACRTKEPDRSITGKWSEVERNFLVEELNSIQEAVNELADTMTTRQWFWKENDTKWSIAEVVEHLELHDQLFRRELTVLTALPPNPGLSKEATDKDEDLLSYAIITAGNSGQSPWYLQPLGRWDTKEKAIFAFNHVRRPLIEFIKTTPKNLRQYFSPSGKGEAKYRDLHQLMLVSIAHAKRHLTQIINIQAATNFPLP